MKEKNILRVITIHKFSIYALIVLVIVSSI